MRTVSKNILAFELELAPWRRGRMMATRAKPVAIIAKFREVKVRLTHGDSVGTAAKSIAVTEQAYYRWCK